MPTYRGIVIGCGKIAVRFEADQKRPRPRSHAGALSEHSRTELVAFVGKDDADRAAAAEFFPHAAFYADAAECIKAMKPDIAIIAASTGTHAAFTILCAEEGVPIIIGEKPVAHSIEDAHRIKGAIEKSGSTFVLNYQRRFFPLFLRARERIAAGALGSLREIVCLYDNGLFNNGGHAIDTVEFLLGERMVSATGVVNEGNTTHPEGDPNIEGTILTENGTKISLQSFDRNVAPIHELRLYGEKGELHIRDFGYTFDWGTDVERESISMTAGALEEAIRAYEEKREPASGIGNGIETLSVLEALKASAAHGGAETPVAVYF